MGTGKTQSAEAFAVELGCFEGGFGGGLTVVDCSQFGVDRAEDLFGRELKLSVLSPYRWRVLILEEFETVSKACQVKLKFWLSEQRIPDRLAVIATSNSLRSIDAAILSRFKVMPFSNGEAFMRACQERIRHLWAMERPGQGLPIGFTAWGRAFERDGYDMRSALQSLSEALAEDELVAA